eukprot:COSAG02_NODE_38632_length_427_cov_0.625000_1_plen_95_part_01
MHGILNFRTSVVEPTEVATERQGCSAATLIGRTQHDEILWRKCRHIALAAAVVAKTARGWLHLLRWCCAEGCRCECLAEQVCDELIHARISLFGL